MSPQFALFLLTGGFAALVNFCSRIFYNQYFDFSLSVLFAYVTGMITAFILAKVFVFKNTSNSVSRSALFFLLVNLAAVLQTWVVSIGLAYYLLPLFGVTNYVNEIAHLVGVIVPVFTSFVGHKKLSFR